MLSLFVCTVFLSPRRGCSILNSGCIENTVFIWRKKQDPLLIDPHLGLECLMLPIPSSGVYFLNLMVSVRLLSPPLWSILLKLVTLTDLLCTLLYFLPDHFKVLLFRDVFLLLTIYHLFLSALISCPWLNKKIPVVIILLPLPYIFLSSLQKRWPRMKNFPFLLIPRLPIFVSQKRGNLISYPPFPFSMIAKLAISKCQKLLTTRKLRIWLPQENFNFYCHKKTSTFTETRKLQLQLSTTTKWKWATFILVWFYDLKMLMKLQNYKIFLIEQNRCMFCYYCRLLKDGQLPATKLSMLNSQMIKAMQTLQGVLSITIPVTTRYRNYFVLTDIFHHY